MPSDFDELYASMGLAALIGHHGRPVTYTPAATQQPANVTAIVGGTDDVPRQDADGRVIGRTRTVEVQSSEVPEPAERDVVTIDGVAWQVVEVLDVHAGKASLKVMRPERAEVVQGPYRIRRS